MDSYDDLTYEDKVKLTGATLKHKYLDLSNRCLDMRVSTSIDKEVDKGVDARMDNGVDNGTDDPYLTVRRIIFENFDKWTVKMKLSIVNALVEKGVEDPNRE